MHYVLIRVTIRHKPPSSSTLQLEFCRGETSESLSSDPMAEPIISSWENPSIQFKGFWLMPILISSLKAIETQYKPLSSDIILASFPKTGTTWLKALTTSILSHNSSNLDPLQTQSPHQLVPFLEIEIFGENPSIDINQITSRPRVFSTHLSYSILPDHIKNSGCRIVYIARNPADTFVSHWHFSRNNNVMTKYSMEEGFDEFCKGHVPLGPYVDHVLEYWNEREKANVFFVTYEELKQDPIKHVKELADFLGCPPLSDEETEEIVENCSLERLRKLEPNSEKAGTAHWSGMKFNSSLRKGAVGDWKNHLSPEMVKKLHQIAKQKWEGSGLESKIYLEES